MTTRKLHWIIQFIPYSIAHPFRISGIRVTSTQAHCFTIFVAQTPSNQWELQIFQWFSMALIPKGSSHPQATDTQLPLANLHSMGGAYWYGWSIPILWYLMSLVCADNTFGSYMQWLRICHYKIDVSVWWSISKVSFKKMKCALPTHNAQCVSFVLCTIWLLKANAVGLSWPFSMMWDKTAPTPFGEVALSEIMTTRRAEIPHKDLVALAQILSEDHKNQACPLHRPSMVNFNSMTWCTLIFKQRELIKYSECYQSIPYETKIYGNILQHIMRYIT